ncbi:hypothetical protein QUA56_24035 [Microcoleus sp. N3A4]|uniref:hypothetical protein n=1 Tax=Microcoleus sp. N3A4 TaxID=3055379 RepID=UPI002FD61148
MIATFYPKLPEEPSALYKKLSRLLGDRSGAGCVSEPLEEDRPQYNLTTRNSDRSFSRFPVLCGGMRSFRQAIAINFSECSSFFNRKNCLLVNSTSEVVNPN